MAGARRGPTHLEEDLQARRHDEDGLARQYVSGGQQTPGPAREGGPNPDMRLNTAQRLFCITRLASARLRQPRGVQAPDTVLVLY